MRYGVILAILVIALAGGWLGDQFQKTSASRDALVMEILVEEEITTAAGDSGESNIAVGFVPKEEQVKGFSNLGKRKYDFLEGPFAYVQLFLAAMMAAGIIYMIKARLQGSAGA